MLKPLLQERLESLVTALTGTPSSSRQEHAQELINFLSANHETEAIAYAVAKAAVHKRAFGKTLGVETFLFWASQQLSYPDFYKAFHFFNPKA